MTVTNTNGNMVINSIDRNMIVNYDVVNRTTSYSVNTNKGSANEILITLLHICQMKIIN